MILAIFRVRADSLSSFVQENVLLEFSCACVIVLLWLCLYVSTHKYTLPLKLGFDLFCPVLLFDIMLMYLI